MIYPFRAAQGVSKKGVGPFLSCPHTVMKGFCEESSEKTFEIWHHLKPSVVFQDLMDTHFRGPGYLNERMRISLKYNTGANFWPYGPKPKTRSPVSPKPPKP